MNKLEGKGIISDDKKSEFQNKLNDVYNVNDLVSVLQWLICVLLAPIMLGFALTSNKVRNRISSPTNRPILERLKERKNDLFSSLKMVANANRENNSMDR